PAAEAGDSLALDATEGAEEKDMAAAKKEVERPSRTRSAGKPAMLRAPKTMAASGRLARDMEERKVVRQTYRKADKTKELVETHYYHHPIGEQDANLIAMNDFWLDYARAASEDGFLSGRFPLAATSATEVM